jgi:hypothetical protein
MPFEDVNLYIQQNSDFYQSFVIQDFYTGAIDISGYSFKAQIRVIPEDTVIAEFDIVITNAEQGNAYLFIPAASTFTIHVNDEFNPYRYDVIMYDADDNQFIIFSGNVYVKDSITKL